MHEIWYWRIAFLASLVMVILAFIYPSFGNSLSSFAVEIIGTFVGFSLAISFAEIARYENSKNKASNLLRLLVREISIIIEILRESAMEIPLEVWEMAISTGDFALLDDMAQGNIIGFFGGFKYYHRAHEIHDLSKLVGVSDEKLELLWEDIKGTAESIVESGEEILGIWGYLLDEK
jgi:hypothetical protein